MLDREDMPCIDVRSDMPVEGAEFLLGDWFVTSSGRQFWPLDPRPEHVDFGDIAHALSHVCRYGGHCLHFYSVAQHSVHVSRLVPGHLARHALMHDAAEAYVGDVVRPLKRSLTDYAAIEERVAAAIAERFHLRELSLSDQAIIKHADNVALVTERRDLVSPHPWAWKEDEQGYKPDADKIVPLAPSLAETRFRERWLELGGFDA